MTSGVGQKMKIWEKKTNNVITQLNNNFTGPQANSPNNEVQVNYDEETIERQNEVVAQPTVSNSTQQLLQQNQVLHWHVALMLEWSPTTFFQPVLGQWIRLTNFQWFSRPSLFTSRGWYISIFSSICYLLIPCETNQPSPGCDN